MLNGLNYEVFVGLFLNVKRNLNRLAYTYALGASIATSDDVIDAGFFDAVCETEEEAADLRFETNAARMLVKARASQRR